MNYEETNVEQEFNSYAKLIELSEEFKKLEKMVTPVDIQTGITTLGRVANLLKKAKEVSEKTHNVEIKEIIIELRSELADVRDLLTDTKIEVTNLKEENETLRQEIQKLKNNQQELIYDLDTNAYYREDDAKKQIAYCPNCWDNRKEKYSFMKINRIGGINMGYICPKCKTTNDKIN